MYMIIYDTLKKMFRKSLKKEKESWNILCLKENMGSSSMWYLLKIWKLVKMEKWRLHLLYIGRWSEWELSRSKVSGKFPSVRSAFHRWICETARRLKHLIALCEPRSISSKSEARELSTPHVWIEESCGLMSWKSKPCFFSSEEREKPKFWGAIVGAKVQNSCVLDLGLTRVQIGKYWILVLIREPEILRRYEWEVEDLPTKVFGVRNHRDAFRGDIPPWIYWTRFNCLLGPL